MSKALVLGTAALVFSAGSAGVAWANGADVPAPDYGYAAPAPAPAPPPQVYAAPPVYAAPHRKSTSCRLPSTQLQS